METLPTKRVPIKSQKFDAGRTINIMKCIDCSYPGHCDFMNCDNYAKQYRNAAYSLDEFKGFYREAFAKELPLWNNDTLGAVFEALFPNFPKNFYWQYSAFGNRIEFKKIGRNGKEITLGEICLNKFKVIEYNLNETQYKFMERVAYILNELFAWVYDVKSEK